MKGGFADDIIIIFAENVENLKAVNGSSSSSYYESVVVGLMMKFW